MGRPKKQWPPQPAENGPRMRVWWNGSWHYLGLKSEPEKWRAELARLIALWSVDPTAAAGRPDDYLVSTLCRDYLASADSPAGGLQRERAVLAVELLLGLFPDTTVADFGPNDLRAWQSWLCGLKRADDPAKTRFNVTTVNYHVATIKRVWRWGVSTERVPADRWQALRAVPRPKPGEARPPRVVEPADPEAVKKTLPFLRPPVRAMVVLQLASGARPSELCGMRAGDVRRSGAVHIPGAGMHDLDALGVWVYVLDKHKTRWKGKPRWLTFGPDVQPVLAPFLDRDPAAYCFSPREAVDGLRAEQRAARAARGGGSGGSRKVAKPAAKRRPGEHYTEDSYRAAVARACKKAGVRHWFPYMLRHAAAAEVKALFDLDAVRALLGHHTRTMAEHYGGESFRKAAEVARKRASG